MCLQHHYQATECVNIIIINSSKIISVSWPASVLWFISSQTLLEHWCSLIRAPEQHLLILITALCSLIISNDPAAAPEEETKWSDPEFDEPEPNTSNIQSNGDSWLQIELCIIFILILQIATKKLCLLKQNIMNYYEGEIMKQEGHSTLPYLMRNNPFDNVFTE